MNGRRTIRVYTMNRYLAAPGGARRLKEAVDRAVGGNPGGHIELDFRHVHRISGNNMDALVRHIRELLAQPRAGRLSFALMNTSGDVARWARRAINQHRAPIAHHEEKRRPTPLELAQWWRRRHP